MLVEIRVRDLGVIEDLVLLLGPGMTALTGETGAGKTLVVEALELLVGGRADTSLVRSGAPHAVVEGRFSGRGAGESDEIVVTRELPAEGRSRAYVDGRMATVGALADLGDQLVDLHGQHAHQSLLHQAAQRQALDHFGGISTSEVDRRQANVLELARRLADLGGDGRQLAREVDLLRFQVGELERASLSDPDEETHLEAEEALLSAAEALRLAVQSARGHLLGEENASEQTGAADLLGLATAELGAHEPLADLAERLRNVQGELADVAAELRGRHENFEDDPERLAAVQARRHLLSELRRKYGEQLSDVIAFEAVSRQRLADLEAGDELRHAVEAERQKALQELAAAEARLGDARRAAAPRLAKEIQSHFGDLALGKGRLEVVVGDGRGDQVGFLFGANPGEPALPLDKVASGGELARVMLATRLVLSEAPPTLVFDEVDAGVGGEAALAVGRALHELAADGHQVLVVTHLAQVAAFADAQVAVTKEVRRGRTVAAARPVEGEDRLIELSRMLSGQPDSAAARRHAEELLGLAGSA